MEDGRVYSFDSLVPCPLYMSAVGTGQSHEFMVFFRGVRIVATTMNFVVHDRCTYNLISGINFISYIHVLSGCISTYIFNTA